MSAEAVFLFPGQGSQYVGMGQALFESHASVKRLFEEASDLAAMDLTRLCFEGPEATLAQTDNVQPAITLVNLACLQAAREEGVTPAATAGHSLGEYSALCAAGVLSFADTIRLVRVRGAAMKEAADRHPGSMVALFGLDFATASAVCDEVKAVGSLEVANQNSPAQVVLTGEAEAVRKATEVAKQRGAKLAVPLRVSGAWHSRFMADAQPRLREALADVELAPPSVPVIANRTGLEYPADSDAARNLLVEQLVSTVRWSDSMRRLLDQGHRVFLELGPGKVLTGLWRDITRDVKAMNVQDTETLAKFRAARAALFA